MISFTSDDTAQDLVEYTLLLAFIALVCAAAVIGIGSSTDTIWGVVNSRLAAANAVSSS